MMYKPSVDIFVWLTLWVTRLAYGGVTPGCISNPTPSESFTNNKVMSADQFVLYWKPSGTKLVIEMHAATTGWVALGLSTDTSMTNSDIVMGSVTGGTGNIQDSFATSKTAPPADSTNDWTLLSSSEAGGCTIIKAEREVIVFDSDDLNITTGTMNVLWAYNSNDDSFTAYHGGNRGANTAQLYVVPPTTTTTAPTTATNTGSGASATINTTVTGTGTGSSMSTKITDGGSTTPSQAPYTAMLMPLLYICFFLSLFV